MRIIYFATYYEVYLQSFYKRHGEFSNLPYREQMQLITSEHFGVFGAYAQYASLAGRESILIVANCQPMQMNWARENDVEITGDWQYSIAAEQVKQFRPDVFFIGSMFNYYGAFLENIKPYCKKIYGWVACPVPRGIKFDQFDLILTSAGHYVDFFHMLNVNSELLPAAFDTRVWAQFKSGMERDIPFSFVGGLSSVHSQRVQVVREIARKTGIKIWGYGYKGPRGFINRYFRSDPVRNNYQGEAWGIEMYSVFARSKISLNVHIAEAEDRSGNMRMYEVTGFGALLLTDKKTAGQQLWVPGKEMIEYESVPDAIEKVNYYLEHETERNSIAQAGQKRTMEQYNYSNNMKAMLDYFEKYL